MTTEFNITNYLDDIIEESGLNTNDSTLIDELKAQLMVYVDRRLLEAISDHLSEENVARLENLANENPEESKINLLTMILPEIKGLGEMCMFKLKEIKEDLPYLISKFQT
jgi:hypothetical protein